MSYPVSLIFIREPEMSSTFFYGQDIAEIRSEQLNQLKLAAKEAAPKRARFCLHRDHADLIQEMVIAFCRGSYVRPHRHINKSESFHVIEGDLLVVFFDNSGSMIRRIEMGPIGTGKTFLYRLNADLWHTVVPLSDYVILHETTTGPFVKSEEDYAAWSPMDNDPDEIELFSKRLISGN